MNVGVNIAGEGCLLTLHLAGWESPELLSGADANWVVGEVEVRAGSMGRFSARQSVSLRTEELAHFRDEVAALLQSLSGSVALEHLEDEFGVKVTLKSGVGELEVFVAEKVGATLRVSGVRTDQSYLAQTLDELNGAVAAFSIRGNAHD